METNIVPENQKFDPAELEQAMINYSRDPFRKALADYLQGNPSLEDIRTFSKKYPDRHAQSVAIFARLSGYTDKLEVEHTHKPLRSLSDAELLALRDELDKQLQTINITPNQSESHELAPTNTGEKKVRGNDRT
jgi:hypothetical protein